MANEKNPDFMKLLEGLKDNEQSDIIKLPRHLIVNLDKVGDNIILFSNDSINIFLEDKVLEIDGKTAQLAYKDEFVQNCLLDYVKTGNREKLEDIFCTQSVDSEGNMISGNMYCYIDEVEEWFEIDREFPVYSFALKFFHHSLNSFHFLL